MTEQPLGVSRECLKAFEEASAEAERVAVAQCLEADRPEDTMGPEAEAMLRSGMQFVTRMLRASLQFAAEGVLTDQVQWGRERLPHYGAHVEMVQRNLRRYADALQSIMPGTTYKELAPYVDTLIAGEWSTPPS